MNSTNRLNTLFERLRARGCRLTPQRVAIVKTLLEHVGHPTVEQIHGSILRDFPTTSLATVYKTINLLKEDREVLELRFGEYGSRYDGRRPSPHPHMICVRCGEIRDADLDGVTELVARMAEMTGYAVTAHRFDLFGVCPACQAGN